MALLNPAFLLGVLLLLYLASFVVLAILRIVTGISIQRIGYFSLRHIAYTPRDGIRLDLRGLGLHLHRPTFAQPTWVSLRLTELKVTVDLKALGGGHGGGGFRNVENSLDGVDGPNCMLHPSEVTDKPLLKRTYPGHERSRTWKRMSNVKEKIKRLQRKIHWLRMVDVVAVNSMCIVTDIACLQIGTFTMAVDTRRKTVDRSRLFQHKKTPLGEQRPAEWRFVVKSVLFTPEGKEALEILDACGLNIHGLLYKDQDGLRDASISLKLGRVHIPYDDFITCLKRSQHCRSAYDSRGWRSQEADISLTDVIEELDMPGSREQNIVQAVSDSKEFVSSILRGIQEVQLAMSFIGMSKLVRSVQPFGSPLYLNVAMNEVGIDLHRLDPKSPAHRMYFSSKDIAHEALLAAISIAISIDDGRGNPDRLIYVPMATTTVKTTLPAKTVAYSEDQNAAQRNANILFANLVVTSPSVDLDPRHLPLVLALLQFRSISSGGSVQENHHLISRLLPKASIKLSVHEPVIRVALPPTDLKLKDTDDYDLLISSISSISLDVESSHSAAGEVSYSLASSFRIASHQLYYQTALGDRHDLLVTEALELKILVNASPEVHVLASGNLQTFSIHMVRPEISAGVHQIVKQLRNDVQAERKTPSATSRNPNFLRRLPPWLTHFKLQGSDFGVEVAGIDSDISENTRGVALQLESWTAEYKAQKNETSETRSSKRRATSRSVVTPTESFSEVAPSSNSAEKPNGSKDGRRLALHVQDLEGFVVESLDRLESGPFLSLPRFEIALTTSSDSQGPIFHVNSYIRTLHLDYSLYRHYAIGVAGTVLRKAFRGTKRAPEEALASQAFTGVPVSSKALNEMESRKELVTVDVKASLLQIKATMPADPPMMLQIYGLDAGRHRWSVPFMKARLVRLYAETPRLKRVWARILSIKNSRVDLRESRRKHGKAFINEKSIDVSAEFIRFAVPHQLILHKVFDNFVNVIKATEQLHHRFKTETNEYVLEKRPEAPKQVPRISVRSKALQFELEDGPFEWKLGTIYRLGLVEQKQRLAREDAFRVKIKKLEEGQHRGGSFRFRTQSSRPHHRGRSEPSQKDEVRQRSNSNGARPRRRSSLRSGRGRNMRYDPEGVCGLSGEATVTAEKAWKKLEEYNSQSWKKRIDIGMRYQKAAMREIRRIFSGADELQESVDETETVLGIPARPGLMSTLISDLHVLIDKPSFPIAEYPRFMNRVGKGMPFDMKYSLVIPMNVQIDMGEARVNLRDYPLPLLHVPAIRLGQSPRLPSWSLKTDFIIAEEFREHDSTRHVQVNVIPPDKFSQKDQKSCFAIDVRRTLSPVKTYSDVNIDINTSHPTSITWGTSYQPAIQDMMMIIEGFTKPQVDLSDRTGFWDKIRLSVHSRVNVRWKGDGDVHLKLKEGARDPYVVTSLGAGFIMCWRNNVQWSIHQDDDPRKFMTVSSGEYVLAVPDYSNQARRTSDNADRDGESSVSSSSSIENGAIFKKVVMKLSGNVRWLAGLVFERNVDGGGRSFAFKPHYEVTLKNLDHGKVLRRQGYDAFKGFRSHHIHLSIAIVAPLNRDWSVTNLKPSSNYNTVHLTPRFFTHFFDWWSMFSGVMTLPVRQGSLWPGLEKSSKKFGRHLATIKYNLLLSPLFIAHIYKHKDAEDYTEDVVSATGLKLRLDSFMLDLHQRREEFATQVKGPVKPIKTSGMRINQAQLDFISADIRAVSASITGTTPEDMKRATDETLASCQQSVASIDISRFTIPDNDLSWIDMDDFVELDWILPAESNPETKIMPLAFAPRFSYFRQTDHQDSMSGDTTRSSPFGNEPTHYCVMSQDNDPRRVQCDLIKERLEKIDQQLETHRRILGEQELRVLRDSYKDESPKEQFDLLTQQGKVLQSKKEFLQTLLEGLSQRLQTNEPRAVSEPGSSEQGSDASQSWDGYPNAETEAEVLESTPLADLVSDFNNRFIAHNVQLKWNNALRNIILRYVHQVSQRRGFVYYMSRRAVKFILDIVEEQHKLKKKPTDSPTGSTGPPRFSPSVSMSCENDMESNVEDRIQQLLDDGKKFVEADDPGSSEGAPKPSTINAERNIAEEFTPQNSYYVRLIAPQIQLQSEKNPRSVLLVTAKGMQLQVIQIMDKDRMADDVSGLVQRRFFVDMDSVQFFVSNQKTLMQYLHMYSGTRYGTPRGSAWPPWVPLEVMFDFTLNPFGFSRVVQKTSSSLRYDKYNTLRLKYNDEVTSGKPGNTKSPENPESRIDHLWVDFPQIRAICDSTQYYTMYIIVLDLLLYNEPLEKVRSEKLEKIMLASDFSDLRGAPEMVISLQERIRQLEEIKIHFQINAKYLDRQGWQDRLAIERDLASCEDELFFMMKAITTSQRKNDERSQSSQTNGLLRWHLSASEVVWHLMREKNEPLMEFQLKNAAYDRTDNSDGSNHNTMVIERIRGLNLLPNALYPEMIAPYFENGRPFTESATKMLRVQWYMLEAIAGIPVLDQFEVDLFPLKIQLEREIGKKLFEYIFPGIGSNAFENGGFSPFMAKHINSVRDEDDGSDVDGQEYTASSEQAKGDAVDDLQTLGTRTGSLALRLKPTMALPDSSRSELSAHNKPNMPGALNSNGEAHHFRLFQHSNKSQSTRKLLSIRTISKRASADSLRMAARQPNDVSLSNLSSLNGNGEKAKKFGLHRSMSKDGAKEKDKPSDDLTQMMSRASNYMTLAYVKIPSVVLCLSYKGKGERNIEDVHEFVFRMPVLEYRNKTWSNLDLALRLKKDVIRALISHTGAIIGNKFSNYRPNKQQQSRLREIANSSSMLPNTDSLTNTSDTGSLQNRDRNEDRSASPRRSFNSGRGSQLTRTESYASSLKSLSAPSATFTTEPPSIPESRAESDDDSQSQSFMHHRFSRRFTSDSHRSRQSRQKTGIADELEEGRKNGMVLLGKKILGSLN